MSAIFGIHHFNYEPVSSEQGIRMMNACHHFPSDNIDSWSNRNIFLGCHNQWITPESIGEIMPYYDFDKRLVITADAIIDNREELFVKLQIHIENRKNVPDSQLILLAYYKWGEEAPRHLKGDFAFMIWDEKKHKLFGARDFSGARTLYFYQNHNCFVFSTLIEPLFTLPYIEKSINEEWLAEFLVIPTMVEAVDTRSTVYNQIQQLPPAHSITVENGGVSLKRYITVVADEKLILQSNEEYVEAFKDVFNKAVKVRLRTHGEVGSHLSGGMDSGTVVSFAAKELASEGKKLHTYSYIPEDSFIDWTSKFYIPDERPFIKETINHVGNIDDHYLSFEGENPYLKIDDFLAVLEMPYKFFENSFWLKGINETAQRNGVKILLNGARGNHSISWGSYQLTMEYYAELLRKMKWIQLNKELNSYCINYRTGKSTMLPFVLKTAFPHITQHLIKKATSEYCFPSFINSSLAERTKVYEKLNDYGINPRNGTIASNLIDHRKNHYQQLFTWNKSGTANTKLSLRYSLWDRDPTNDINVIRFCLALPNEQYVNGGMERTFLRRATKNILPDKVRLNHRTRGIQGADTIHRMTSNWNDFYNEIQIIINDSTMRELINSEEVNRALMTVGREPSPNIIFSDEFKIITRSLILYRFIKKLEGGDKDEKRLEKAGTRDS